MTPVWHPHKRGKSERAATSAPAIGRPLRIADAITDASYLATIMKASELATHRLRGAGTQQCTELWAAVGEPAISSRIGIIFFMNYRPVNPSWQQQFNNSKIQHPIVLIVNVF
jgi:hypothetical protein